jgi:hypothetical protein
MTKQEMIERITAAKTMEEIKKMGFVDAADDGNGHHYMVKTHGAAIIRLVVTDVQENASSLGVAMECGEPNFIADDDVSGWENV